MVFRDPKNDLREPPKKARAGRDQRGAPGAGGRFEVTSENDLFFHFTHSVDENNFREMQVRRADLGLIWGMGSLNWGPP